MSFFRNAFAFFRNESHKIPQIVKDAPYRQIATDVIIGITFFSGWVMYDQYISGDNNQKMNSQLEKILEQETENGRKLSLILDRLEEMGTLNREFRRILDSLKNQDRYSKCPLYCKRWPNVEALKNQDLFRQKFLALHKDSADLPLVNKTMMYLGRHHRRLSSQG